jgi:urease accessory protein
MRLSVGEGACLTVRSAGATMLLGGAPVSTLAIDARVEANGSLDWAPEPIISTSQSHHSQRTLISLAANAQLRWREVVVLGRSGESPGILGTSLRITRDQKPVLHNGLRLDAGMVQAGLGGARVLLTEVLIGGPPMQPFVTHQGQARAAVVALEPDVVLIQALGDSPDQVEALARQR